MKLSLRRIEDLAKTQIMIRSHIMHNQQILISDL